MREGDIRSGKTNAGNCSSGDSEPAISGGSRVCPTNDRDIILGSVPSRDEVEKAITDLQRFMHALSTSAPELDGLHALLKENPNTPQVPVFSKCRDALSMMQKEPALKDMVVSISSDKAVWDAVLRNKAIQDLQGSVSSVKGREHLMYKQETDMVKTLLDWILGFTKYKVLELVGRLEFLVHEVFRIAPKDKPTTELTHLLEETLCTSLLLSVVLLLIVVATRIRNYS